MRLAAPAALCLTLACGDPRPMDAPPLPREPACRRLEASPAGPGDVDGLFPLAVGDSWFHNVSTDVAAFTVRTVVGEPSPLGGVPVFPRTMRGVDALAFPATRFFSNGPGGVMVHAEPGTRPPLSLSFPHLVVRWPVVEGDRYETFACTDVPTAYDLDRDGKLDRYDVTQTVTVGPVESIEALLGTVEGRRITTRTVYRFQLTRDGLDEASETEDAWFVPGMGRIGSLGTRERSGVTTTIADLLSGYAVGGAREGLQRLETLTAPAYGAPAVAIGAEGALVAAGMGVEGAPYLGGLALGGDAVGVVGLMTAGEDARRTPAIAASRSGFLVAQAYPDGVRFARTSAAAVRLDAEGGLPLATDLGVTGLAVASDGDGWGVLWSGAAGMRLARVDAGGEVLGVTGLSAAAGRAPALLRTGGRYLALWVPRDGRLHAAPVDDAGQGGAEAVVDLGDVRGFAASADGDDAHALWLDGSRTVRTALLAADGRLVAGSEATLYEAREIDAVYDLRLGFDGTNHVATFSVFSLDGLRTGVHVATITPAGVPVPRRTGLSTLVAAYGELGVALPPDGGDARVLWKIGGRFQIGTFAF